jgi:hypothetical protein
MDGADCRIQNKQRQEQNTNAEVPFDFAQGRLLHYGGKSAASGRDDEFLL